METLECRRVLAAVVPHTGDYNLDGVVDTADYTVWRDQLDSAVVAFSGADGDGSGVVDQLDYDLWSANYGLRSATEVPTVSTSQPIMSGADWHDIDGNPIEAHEGGILQEGGTFYLYGTDRSSNNQWFKGVNLYSSTDLVHWQFEKTILDFNSHPALQDRVLERPKILRNPTTGQYTMWWHHESYGYGLAEVGVAISDTIDGDYTFQGSFRPLGYDSRDIGMFQDTDGEAYLLSSVSGNQLVAIFRLNATYTGIEELVYLAGGNFNGEGLSIAKHEGTYFFFKSAHNGWTPNDNTYSTATSLDGPWTYRGRFVPTGSRTFYAQNYNTMVVNGTEGSTVFFMGDRWQPQAQSQSRTVFLPLTLNGASASLQWRDAWTIDTVTGLTTNGESHLSGLYKIVSRDNGQTLTASGTGNASVVEQAAYTGAAEQQWVVTQLGPNEGSYRISNLASRRVLDVAGNSPDDGATIIVYDDFAANNQKWRISPTDSGYYSVSGVSSRKVLEVPGGSDVEGDDVSQRGRRGDAWQQWAFIPVDEAEVPASPANLVATIPTSGPIRTRLSEVRLDWTPVPGADFYQVKRSTTANGPFVAYGPAITVPSSTVRTTVDHPFYYRVSATNSFGEGADSETVRHVSSWLRARYAAEGDTQDSGGGAIHAENNGASFVPGHDGGQAWAFNGVNQTVTLPRVVGLDDFTISFWMKTTQTGGVGGWSDGKGLVDASIDGPFADFGVSLLGDKVAFGVGGIGYNAGAVTDTTLLSDSAVSDGQWRHVAATYDAGAGLMRLYVDGALEASVEGPKGARTAPQAIRVGSIQSLSAGGFYEGAIDEVQLYEGALSASAIEALASVSGSLSQPTTPPVPDLATGQASEADIRSAGAFVDSAPNQSSGATVGRVQQATSSRYTDANDLLLVDGDFAADVDSAIWALDESFAAEGDEEEARLSASTIEPLDALRETVAS